MYDLRTFILSPRFDPLLQGRARDLPCAVPCAEMACTAGEEDDAMLPYVLPPSETSAQTQAKKVDAPSQGPLHFVDEEC